MVIVTITYVKNQSMFLRNGLEILQVQKIINEEMPRSGIHLKKGVEVGTV